MNRFFLFSILIYMISSPTSFAFVDLKPVDEISNQVNKCKVDITSKQSIIDYLSTGLRTEMNGGSVIRYKDLMDWNTVGLEIKFDNGNRVSGINVRITPGITRARISVDFPDIGSGVYYLTSDGLLESSDGRFLYKCR